MNRSTIYGLKIDFDKSIGSYIFDKSSQQRYLDFFGQYSTLTLGYNHPVFYSKEFQEEILRVSRQKTVNCEISSDEAIEFDLLFRSFTSKGIFSHYHYASTGALAVEAAIKTAMFYKKANKIVAFKNSFHGINSYGGMITDRTGRVNRRLDGMPSLDVLYASSLEEVQNYLSHNFIGAILIEPIQSTAGDLYFNHDFWVGLRELATEYDVPLIFDEIQTGFCVTGKVWYWEYLPIIPDILIFGKKAQLSGIAVQKPFAEIFNHPVRLEVTWDADVLDMIRGKYIIQTIINDSILNNVQDSSNLLKSILVNRFGKDKVRNCGLLLAFDFDNQQNRNEFVDYLYDNKILVNSTEEKTVRLRPNLCVTKHEIEEFSDIINKF